MLRALRHLVGEFRLALRRLIAVALIRKTSVGSMNDEWIEKVRRLWGNGGFVARASFLKALIEQGSELQPGDRVLDIGSGLSTLILHHICEERGAHLYSLEHHPGWTKSMRRIPGLDRVIIECPLVSYGSFEWYAIPPRISSLSFQLAAVDGPPERTTRGSRYGLLPCLMNNLAGATIIVDDYRPTKPWVLGWIRDYGVRFSPRGEIVAEVLVPARAESPPLGDHAETSV